MGDKLEFVNMSGGGGASAAAGGQAAGATATFSNEQPEARLMAGRKGGGASDVVHSPNAPGFLRTSKHPVICIVHLIFKVAALLVYFVGRHVFDAYILTFIFTVLLLAFDFWAVKNVTGRILVGLRWWNDIKEDGSSEWIFESISDESVVNPTDRKVFWMTLYIWPVIWTLFLVMNLFAFDFNWLLLIVMALTFAGSNCLGYWKCSKDAKKRMREWASSQALSAVVQNVF